MLEKMIKNLFVLSVITCLCYPVAIRAQRKDNDISIATIIERGRTAYNVTLNYLRWKWTQSRMAEWNNVKYNDMSKVIGKDSCYIGQYFWFDSIKLRSPFVYVEKQNLNEAKVDVDVFLGDSSRFCKRNDLDTLEVIIDAVSDLSDTLAEEKNFCIYEVTVERPSEMNKKKFLHRKSIFSMGIGGNGAVHLLRGFDGIDSGFNKMADYYELRVRNEREASLLAWFYLKSCVFNQYSDVFPQDSIMLNQVTKYNEWTPYSTLSDEIRHWLITGGRSSLYKRITNLNNKFE